ncbi:MAG: VCBS repeat-containing protein [Deltaproteobacteria bacterium]|nr:VCBS repeat-containing protein [Deltaproteobacteria bacterium]
MPRHSHPVILVALLVACGGDSGSKDTATSTTETDATTTTDATTATDATSTTEDSSVATDTTATSPTDTTATVPTDATSPTDTSLDAADTWDVITDPLLLCEGRCDIGFTPELPCQCNDRCMEFGNCCVDYCGACGETAVGCDPGALSCEGRCGQFQLGAPCQCDAGCAGFGNCCDDYATLCTGTEVCEDPELTDCGTGCIDTDISTEFCGSCATPCDDKGNQKTTCAGGQCTRACLPGFEDCNDDPDDGCEAELARDPDNCGVCEKVCDSGPFGAPVCQGGQCALACNEGRGACNDVTFDGCETDTTSSEDHCGYCGVSCPTLPNTEPVCATSACTTVCLDGFESCDGKAMNGCEADLDNDEATCGACDVACGPAETCQDGGCACTGTFGYLVPPTPRYAVALADDTFAFALTCNLAESSLDDAPIHISGAQGGAVAGTLAREGGNGLRWTSGGGSLLAGEEVDITLGAGFRSFDSLKSSAYRVIKARAATSSEGSGLFIAGQAIDPGEFMEQVVLGDFDGDGDLDMATDAFTSAGTIYGSVHLNNGSGELGATVGEPGEDAFQALGAHDFNRDGYVDLLVFNLGGGSSVPTRVLWGAATNPLSTDTDIASIGDNLSPAIGDIDGDGDLDLVVGRRVSTVGTNTGAKFLYDSATNTFGSAGAISTTATAPYFGALVDVDDDGDLDLFQANSAGFDRVFTNDGSGAFTSAATYGASGTEPIGLDVGDLNGDGYPDALVVNRTTDDKIYLGSAAGTFTEIAAPQLTGVEGSPSSRASLADIDGDGDLDIVGINASKLTIYRNDGAAAFSGGATAFDSIGFAIGDLDGDGDLDIANITSGSAGVRILRNTCSGDTCTCGNGALDGNEQCDDGPTGSAFCDPDCTEQRCGDGDVNALANEQCDDGNDIDDDACRNSCVATTCSDGLRNGSETDVDCGGGCATRCAARKACELHDDCASGICAGFVCAYHADFEDGVIPAAFSTGPNNPWLVDATTPIADSARSLISHDFTVQGTSSSAAGNSSLFLTATFGAGGGMLVFDVQTNCSYSSVLSLRIDGVKVVELYGRRLQLDDGYGDSYEVPAGTHTFEWRYESKIGSGEGLLFPPYHRAWIDNVVLINGAP